MTRNVSFIDVYLSLFFLFNLGILDAIANAIVSKYWFFLNQSLNNGYFLKYWEDAQKTSLQLVYSLEPVTTQAHEEIIHKQIQNLIEIHSLQI